MKLGQSHRTFCGCLRIAAHRIDGLARPFQMTFDVGTGRAASFTTQHALNERRGELLEAAQDDCQHCAALQQAYVDADIYANPDLLAMRMKTAKKQASS